MIECEQILQLFYAGYFTQAILHTQATYSCFWFDDAAGQGARYGRVEYSYFTDEVHVHISKTKKIAAAHAQPRRHSLACSLGARRQEHAAAGAPRAARRRSETPQPSACQAEFQQCADGRANTGADHHRGQIF